MLLVWLWVQLVHCSKAAELSLKVTDKEPPKQFSESIRKALQPKAVQLLNGETPAFEFWFSSEIPLKSKPVSAAKALDALQDTTLLGAVTVGAGQRDYERSRNALRDLAGACNRCHQAFRVSERVTPFADAAEGR